MRRPLERARFALLCPHRRLRQERADENQRDRGNQSRHQRVAPRRVLIDRVDRTQERQEAGHRNRRKARARLDGDAVGHRDEQTADRRKRHAAAAARRRSGSAHAAEQSRFGIHFAIWSRDKKFGIDAVQAHRVAAAHRGVHVGGRMHEVQHAARAVHHVEVQLLRQPLPQLQRDTRRSARSDRGDSSSARSSYCARCCRRRASLFPTRRCCACRALLRGSRRWRARALLRR